MIEYRQGNLLDNIKPGNLVVQGCNAQGVMGSGIAKQIRDKYPECFTRYKKFIERSSSPLGSVCFYWEVVYNDMTVDNYTGNYVTHNSPYETYEFCIVNAITQEFYGRDPKVVYVNYAAIVTCFVEIFKVAKNYNFEVHIPKIGAGLANGHWGAISLMIEESAKLVKFEGKIICLEYENAN